MSHILVIDDDTELCELLSQYLKPEGFEITSVYDGEQGLRLAISEAGKYDLIVLDVMLPGMSGFEVLQHLRHQSDTPVLMLTARDEEVLRIMGLEMGADDYLPKPFNPRELIARARAILRRTKDRHDKNTALSMPEKISVGDIELDTGTRVVKRSGERIELTSVEFGFLEMLLRAAGHVVTREQLTEGVLGRPLTPYDRSVDVHLSSLRKKLGHKLGEIERIKTVRGAGYVYVNPAQPDRNTIPQ
ncbi:MAG: response regulator transcription factor [Syntrophobacteraceae bacterium]